MREKRGGSEGFALPLVVLVVLMGTMVVTLIAQRQFTSQAVVRRQLDLYEDHHEREGINEVLRVWLQANNREQIAQKLDEDGLALMLEIQGAADGSGGGAYEVYMFDAQGAVLVSEEYRGAQTDTDALRLARRVEGLLPVGASDEQRQRLLRRVGPSEVNVNSAPREVLEQVGWIVAGESDADALAFANAVLTEREEREDRGLFNADISRLAREAGFDTEQIQRLISMLATRSVVWRVELVRVDRIGQELYRSRGIIDVSNIVEAGTDDLYRRAPFLSWERVEP